MIEKLVTKWKTNSVIQEDYITDESCHEFSVSWAYYGKNP
jgi:hypothetical protein